MNWLQRTSQFQYDEPSHDYEITWDHEPDEDVSEDIQRFVQKIVERLKQKLLPKIKIFKDFKVEFVNSLPHKYLATYISGTFSMPIIAIDMGNIEMACENYDSECHRAIEMSILHELGHAIQEAQNKPLDEDEAEDFARQYYDTEFITLSPEAKPMALPATRPKGTYDHWGYRDIDEEMTEETATEEKERYPEISYLGAGIEGVAYDLRPGVVGKYTKSKSEVDIAQLILNQGGYVPGAVKIFDVREVQPGLWIIEMEKLEELERNEQEILYGIAHFRRKYNRHPTESDGDMDLLYSLVTGVGFVPQDKADLTMVFNPDIYNSEIEDTLDEYITLIRTLHKSGIRPRDPHQGNVGRNSEGKITMFDFGMSSIIENDLAKAGQSKPMALPVKVPEEAWAGPGAFMVDDFMPESVAEKEQKKYPDMSYIGSGASGIAVDLPSGRVGKYTTSGMEARRAEALKETGKIPGVVQVYSIRQIKHNLWMIELEKAQSLDWQERKAYDNIRGWTWTGEKTDPQERMELALKQSQLSEEEIRHIETKYKEMMMKINHAGFTASDIGSDNVGWDNNLDLVVLDVGGVNKIQ